MKPVRSTQTKIVARRRDSNWAAPDGSPNIIDWQGPSLLRLPVDDARYDGHVSPDLNLPRFRLHKHVRVRRRGPEMDCVEGKSCRTEEGKLPYELLAVSLTLHCSPMLRFLGTCLLLMGAFVLLLAPCAAQADAPLLNPVFQDYAVLQRDAPIRIWGTAPPGDTVSVMIAGASSSAVADSTSAWTVELPALDAGGPHRLVARSTGGRVQTLTDVMVGDVYLCSGQSNMELPVDRTLNAPSEIGSSANDRIRMMTVDRASSAVPERTVPSPVEWELASPETVAQWSASCYYFARNLQNTVDVPLGLIHSAWGGTSITSWMSRDALSTVGGHDESLALLDQYTEDRQAAQQTFGEQWEAWWRNATNDPVDETPWQPEVGTEWPHAPDGLGDWKEWGRPALSDFHGMMWFRTTIELSAEQAANDAVLSLGAIDEVDQTWLNGQIVGNTFGWGTERTYSIPAQQLEEGENVVVVNVQNSWGQGGMLSPPPSRSLITGTGEQIALANWQYQKVSSDMEAPPRTPWEPIAGLSPIHNAMLAPLHNYNLRGIVWYQGESDTDKGRSYLEYLQALKTQWRSQFGENVPVLIVQLANFGSRPTAPTTSGWAEVREAQRLSTENDPYAGLAVTIDIGSPYDIHPANKQEVGRRLSRAARHVVYGEDISPSGPVPSTATQRGDSVVVAFEDIHEALVAYSHSKPIGFELCGPEPERCEFADARIDGSRLILDATDREDVARVRYCWADSPVCTLYDEAGLPAGPFELDVSAE